MQILADVPEPVQPGGFNPFTDDSPDRDSMPLTDAQWVLWQGVDRRKVAAPGDDVAGLVAGCLEQLHLAMRWARTEDAVSFARRRRLDLAAVVLPVPPFRARVAAGLVAEAAWFLSLDTPAGRLAAGALLSWAAIAEEVEADDVDEFLCGEAAYRQARIDAVMEAAGR